MKAYSHKVETSPSVMAVMQPYHYGTHKIEISFEVKGPCSSPCGSDDLESKMVSEARV